MPSFEDRSHSQPPTPGSMLDDVGPNKNKACLGIQSGGWSHEKPGYIILYYILTYFNITYQNHVNKSSVSLFGQMALKILRPLPSQCPSADDFDGLGGPCALGHGVPRCRQRV